MAKIESYSKAWYPCCTTAEVLLRNKDLSYQEIDVSSDAVREQDEDRALTAPVGAADLHR